MGKKIDLNSPRKSTSGSHNRRVNHLFSRSTPNNNGINDGSNPSKLKQKGMETGLRAAGVPQGIAKSLAENEKTYELAEKLTATIKFPIKNKVTIVAAFIMMPFLLLMIFVVLFSDASAAGAGSGSFAYGADCQTVTVTDTDCDENENCKNTYSGEVEFEDYIAGVVAAEAGNINNIEYYKTVAVSARTYLLNNAGSSCQVEGNTNFQTYIPVEESPYSSQIKQAVEKTKGKIIAKSDTELERNIEAWYKNDNIDTNCINEECLNKDEGMTNSGVTYLITQKNYNYEQVIEYYYGDSEIKSAYAPGTGILVEGFINPTDRIVCTSAYGYRCIFKGCGFHNGIDIAVTGNIYATKSGTVTAAVNQFPSGSTDSYYCQNNNRSCGNYVVIQHEDGYRTTYCHIMYNTIPSYVYVGAQITQGQVIGNVGSTGCSSGAHLHYALRKDGNTIDPADYLNLDGATGTCRN